MGLFSKIFGTRSQREVKKIQPMVDQILALENEYKALSEDALKGKTENMGLFSKIFGTRSQREVKKIQPMVDQILALENEYKALSEDALKGKTEEFKQRLASGQTLDDLLPEAFAAIREAADRVLGMRPYPVQLIGGIVLHQGRIAEMKTGEGKTLVAILAHRRYRAPSGQNCRDEDRRRKDSGGHPALLPECLDGEGRPCGHRQRLDSGGHPALLPECLDGEGRPCGHRQRLPLPP